MRNPAVDHDWLALHREEALDPHQQIIDPHHHMWDRPGWRYLPPDMLRDIHDGHRIVATVHVEDEAGYRSYGPTDMRPLGEDIVEAFKNLAAKASSYEKDMLFYRTAANLRLLVPPAQVGPTRGGQARA